MDSAISLAIVLFILSMINERIANFIKLQFSDKKLLFIPLGNLRHKGSVSEEDDRTKRILAVNIVCGTLVALALRADLIVIVNHIDKPWEGIGWNKPFEKYEYYTLFIGCFLTGCFLSLGSKFWHDLLDVLLTTKNLKQKLLDERSYQDPQTANQVVSFILTPDFKFSQSALTLYRQKILAIEGVLSVGAGYLAAGNSKKSCIEIHVSNSLDVGKIEKSYPVEYSPGNYVQVPTKVIVTGDRPRTSAVMASKGIANQSLALGNGTIGAIVLDNKNKAIKYVLSCFHVLNGDANWNRVSNSRTVVAFEGTSKVDIGTLTFGYRTQEIDAALAQLRDGLEYSNNLINNPTSVREVTVSDAVNSTKVSVLGAKTGVPVDGFIYNDAWPAKFKYPDGKEWELIDLLVLTKTNSSTNSYETLTQGGDSGAFVLDSNNEVVGMVVGGDKAFTYAIKATKIFKNFDITLT